MNINRVRLFLVFALAMMLSSNALAARNQDTSQCYETVDACFHEGDWWYQGYEGSGGGGAYTRLECGLTEGCKTCGTTSLGKPVCVKVRLNASCKCEILPVEGAGPNIVYCSEQGTCEYRG